MHATAVDPAAADVPSGLASALFTTTQQRLLGLLFGQPERSFYANELISLTASGSGAVQRELARLVKSGLVASRLVGRQKHYQANPDSPIFAELHAIANKTMALAEPLRNALAPLAPRITSAFVYGSVAKKQDTASSDVDLMLVGDDLSYPDVFDALEEACQRVGREVKPTIYSRREWADRISRGDGFVRRVMAQPKVWLYGSAAGLAEP